MIDNHNNMVNLRQLKATIKRLPETAPLRRLILSQPDEMPLSEYIIKAKDWILLVPEN